MDSEEAKYAIRLLAQEWAKAELPSKWLIYGNFLNAIGELQTMTNDLDRTKQIFHAVLAQATALGKSSEWVEYELTFEAKSEATGDRAKCLRLEVAAQTASDASLDLFNERTNRFI